jgi:hypothetical protein
MSENKYPNSGALYKNDRMRPDRQDPEYNGSCEVDGVEYWISAWLKEGKKGKFFSLSFKPKEKRDPMDQRPQSRPEPKPQNEDDPPF